MFYYIRLTLGWIALILGCNLPVRAQQIPLFNQYIFMPQFSNPARMGEGFVAVNYRRQGSELESRYAPSSFFVQADLSSALQLREKRIGLGAGLLADKAHILNRYQGSFNFAYHLFDWGGPHQLGLGISAGLLSQRINVLEDLRISNPFDQAVFAEQQTKMTFNAGPGLYYQFTSASGHALEFDASFPQMFAGDLTYENGSVIDLSPHMLLRTSFRYQGSNFTLAPILMYRELLGEKKLKAGNMDLAFRAGFMDERFWLGGGMRLDAETFHFALGVTPVSQISILGAFDMHSVWGSSFEAGAMIAFGKDEKPPREPKTPKPPVTPSMTKNQVRQQLADLAYKSDIQVTSMRVAEQGILSLLGDAETTLQNIKNPSTPARAKRGMAEAAARSFAQGRSKYELEILPLKQQLDEAQGTSQKLISTKWANMNWPEVLKINSKQDEAEVIVNGLVRRIQTLDMDIQKTRESLPLEWSYLLKRGSIAQVDSMFKSEFNNLAEKPRNMEIADIQANGANGFTILYQFPNAVDKYNLTTHEQLLDLRQFADFLMAQWNEVQATGAVIESIKLSAQLRDTEATLRQVPGGSYEGDFGARFPLPYRFINQAGRNPVSSNKNPELRQGGSINLEQLAALKLMSLRIYLQSKGVNASFDPLEITAPNSGQNFSQQYRMLIRVRR